MSTTEHHDAMLPGYLGPFFPESVRKLGEQINRPGIGVNGSFLNMVAQRMHGVASRYNSETSDGYSWFWAIMFNNSDVVILIPWSQDRAVTDGSKADRSIALHIQSGMPARGDAIVQEFTKLLTEEIDRAFAARTAHGQALWN